MMKRYDPTANCENAVMVESENGDYVDYDDMKRFLRSLLKDSMAETELAVALLRRVLDGEMGNEIYWEVREFIDNWDKPAALSVSTFTKED